MLDDEGATGKKRALKIGGVESGEEGSSPENLDGCEVDELGETGVKYVEKVVRDDVVKREV